MLRLTASVVLNTGKETILESSHSLYKLLRGFLLIDNFYSKPIFRKEGFDNVSLDLKIAESEAINTIQDVILKFSTPDIKKYDKVSDIDNTFSRDYGFSILVCYDIKKGSEVSFTTNIGSSSVNAIGLLSSNGFTVDNKVSSDWIKYLVDTNLVKYGIVKISDVKFLKQVRKYKSPLGLVTYFSKNFEIEIPNDLEGVEYDFTDRGKFLSIVSEEDFKESDIDIYKEKLLNVMEQIERRVPEYLK